LSGVILLVTMANNKTEEIESDSGFALRFLRSQNDTVFHPERILYLTSFVTGEGRQTGSFPDNNAVGYENNANHLMIIYRANEQDCNLPRSFLDTEEDHDYIRAFGIKYEPEETRFRLQT